MSLTTQVAANGGIGAACALATAVIMRVRPGRIRVNARVISDQAEAAREQTRAIERQTKASNAVATQLGQLGGRMDATAAEIGELTAEVRGLRADLRKIDRRVIRLEATHETNGHPGHHKNGSTA